MTLNEFLSMVKVLRMLYGKQLAIEFFEKNVKHFPNLSIDDLNSLKKSAKLTSPLR